MLALLLAAGLGEPPALEADPPAEAHTAVVATQELELHWSAPPQCPPRSSFVDALRKLSGQDLTIVAEAGLKVDVSVEAKASGYELRLQLTSPQRAQTRRFEAPNCAALIEAGSLVVLTELLVPEQPATLPAVPAPPPEQPSNSPTPIVPLVPAQTREQPPAPAPLARTEPPPVRPTPRSRIRVPLRLGVSVLAGGAFGSTPRPTGSIGGGVALLLPHARAEISAQHAFATTTATDGVVIGRVSAALTRVGVVGCWAPRVGPLDFPLCSGVELGVATGRGAGTVQSSRTSRQLWAAVPVTVGIAWAPTPRFAVRALAGPTIALRRPGFHLRAESGAIGRFRTSMVSALVLAGIEVRFP